MPCRECSVLDALFQASCQGNVWHASVTFSYTILDGVTPAEAADTQVSQAPEAVDTSG
jgi:hypothetical protein